MRAREGGSGTEAEKTPWRDSEMHLAAQLSSRTRVLAQKCMMNGTEQEMEHTGVLANKGGCRAGGTMAMRDGAGADSSTGRCWETRYRWAEMGDDKKSMLHATWDEGVLQLLRNKNFLLTFLNASCFDCTFLNLVRSETHKINNISET